VGGPCITLGFVLRETASRISIATAAARRNSSANVGLCTPSHAHHVLIGRGRNTRIDCARAAMGPCCCRAAKQPDELTPLHLVERRLHRNPVML
jgi:hypothetical protein